MLGWVGEELSQGEPLLSLPGAPRFPLGAIDFGSLLQDSRTYEHSYLAVKKEETSTMPGFKTFVSKAPWEDNFID